MGLRNAVPLRVQSEQHCGTGCMIGLEEWCPTQSTGRAALRNRLHTFTQMLARSEAETQCCMALPTIGLSKGLAAGGHQAAVVGTPAAAMQSASQQSPAAGHTGCVQLDALPAYAPSCSHQTRWAFLTAHQLGTMQQGFWMATGGQLQPDSPGLLFAAACSKASCLTASRSVPIF